MPTKVQLRRGSTTEHASFTGMNGEVTVDTTRKSLVVHDGSTAGGVPVAKLTEAIRIEQVSKTASHTLTAADSGKHISITAGGVTVPAGVFAVGDVVTIFNDSTSSQAVTQGASVTLINAGTTNTGNRSLGAYGLCTVLCVSSNRFIISGIGLS